MTAAGYNNYENFRFFKKNRIDKNEPVENSKLDWDFIVDIFNSHYRNFRFFDKIPHDNYASLINSTYKFQTIGYIKLCFISM